MDPKLMLAIQNAVHEVLVWIGFGTLVGLAAKAIMPGKDPGGTVATLMMGIAGCVVGCGTIMFFVDGAKLSPISLGGFFAATLGAFILLFFYRLLSGSFLVEAETGETWITRARRRRRQQAIARDL